MDDRTGQIAHNIAAVRKRIAAAAARAGRQADQIRLIAVTKTHPPRVIAAALAASITECGENRVQEADDKIALLAQTDLHWHLIGHLQRNKAKRAAALFDLIHSLDSLRLAETLNRHVEETSLLGQRRLAVLLQVNLSGEATKEGFGLVGGVKSAAMDQFVADARTIVALPYLDVQGLMTVAPYADDPEDARPVFRMLRDLRDQLVREVPHAAWQHLSMGMTNDFEVAIEEGATFVRVGRAIFGERPPRQVG